MIFSPPAVPAGKAAWYRKTGGQLRRFAVGHTVEVAANHYGDIPALRPIHEATIAEALMDAVEDALRPTVLTPEAEAEVLAALPAPPGFPDGMVTDVPALLAGEQDVWLASCAGFYRSPFTISGEACPVPFWGCLECRNGVITTRKLPALMAFLDFVVDRISSRRAKNWIALKPALPRSLQRMRSRPATNGIATAFAPGSRPAGRKAVVCRSGSVVQIPPAACPILRKATLTISG